MADQEDSGIGIKCIKYLLCLANFLFIMTALLIISVGTTIYAIYNDFDQFLEQRYFSPASLLIAVGIIILVVSILGFLGAIKESSCITMMFSVMLGVILVLELGAAFAAFAMPGGVSKVIQENLINVMDHYKYGNEEAAAMDFLQQRLMCCGCYGKEDWTKLEQMTEPPLSCCTNITVTNDTTTCTSFEPEGCLDKLVYLVYQSSIMLGTGALSIALVQLLGMTFACMLSKSIRRAKTARQVRRWQFRNDIINGENYYTELSRGDVKVPVLYTPTTSEA